ncbi:MAG TPA: hypothetical protein VF812_12255 [Ktedonobacterales bacterium]
MTEKAKRPDQDDAREERERLTADMSQEFAPNDAPSDDLFRAATSEDEAPTAAETPVLADGESTESSETARPRARRSTRKAPAAPGATQATERTPEPVTLSAYEADAIELEAQGFSADEAQRLIAISRRLETSAEARAAQAELKRLRFTQWLIEHGVLDEFSA